MNPTLREVYRRLLDALGPQQWWPGETPFEVMVGAVLTQNTNWSNVEKAIQNLRDAGLLDPAAMAGTAPETLAELIRPSGYYRQKSGRLARMAAWLSDTAGGKVERLRKMPADGLRRQLLALSGIGPETADSILLYALDKPVFVVDAYTFRVLTRHGLARSSGRDP